MGVATRKKTTDRSTFDATAPKRWDSPNHTRAAGLNSAGQVIVTTRVAMAAGTAPRASQK